MPKKRISLLIEDADHVDIEEIKRSKRLVSDSAAIRFAIHAIAERLRKDAGSGS